METFWFIALTFMLAMYIVLDGFDLGAGILHLFVAKTNKERQAILKAIGPFWDGNEVWLIAAGGTLFMAFPRFYATAFSGFYLALIIFLWLLILRAIAIELRGHIDHPMWTGFWDVVFAGSSFVITLVLGVALGNLVRGVNIGADGYFFTPLWTDFLPGANPGLFDWFSLSFGVLAVFAIALHGALYLSAKIEGDMTERIKSWLPTGVMLLTALVAGSIILTKWVREDYFAKFSDHPIGFALPILAASALIGIYFLVRKENMLWAFVSSGVFILSMAATTAFAIFPTLLHATDGISSLTVFNSASATSGLQVSLYWWIPALFITIGYFVYLYYMFRGKVSV